MRASINHLLRLAAALLTLGSSGLLAVEAQLVRQELEQLRRLELGFEHVYYANQDDRMVWLPGTVVVSLAGPESRPTAWVTVPAATGRGEITRMHIDERDLRWDATTNRLTGQIVYGGYTGEATHTLQLELQLSGGRVHGRYRNEHKRSRGDRFKDQSEQAGTLTGRCWYRKDLMAAHGFGQAAWPGWRGGDQAGVANDNSNVELISDLYDARFVWKSSETTTMPGHTDRLPLSGYGEISFADNKVFLNYYAGYGDVYPEGKSFEQILAQTEAVVKDKRGRGIRPYIDTIAGGDVAAYVSTKYPVLATDIIDCYDALTGRLLWQARFPGNGLNWYNCNGPHFQVTYEAGRVYVVGSAGALYCLDASSGETIWQSWMPGIEALPERLANALAEAKNGGKPNKDGPSDLFVNKPYAMDGVLVVAERGMYGLDGRTGKVLWGPIEEVRNGNPRPWRHQGQTYALCRLQYGRGGLGAGIACVEVKTGRLLWVDRRFAGDSGREFANDSQFLFAGGAYKEDDEPAGETIYEPTCYRLGLKGMKKLWSMEPITGEQKMAAPVLYDGYVHTYWHGGGQMYVVCIEAATGKEVGRYGMERTRKFWQSLTGGNGRIYHTQGQHTVSPMLFAAGAQFGILHDGLDPDHRWAIPGTFQVLSPIMVDGRLFVREKENGYAGDSRIYCYDLRKPR